MFFVMSLCVSDHKVVTQPRIFIKFFSISLGFSRTSNVWSLRSLIKQLFHSHLLDMRLVIAPRWLFTISYPTRAHGTIVKYSTINAYVA